MSEKEVIELFKKAIETYGKDNQITVAIEEMSELQKELCKYKRKAQNRKQIIEEMADCHIMLRQLYLMFDVSDDEYMEQISAKLNRLEKTIEKEKREESEK